MSAKDSRPKGPILDRPYLRVRGFPSGAGYQITRKRVKMVCLAVKHHLITKLASKILFFRYFSTFQNFHSFFRFCEYQILKFTFLVAVELQKSFR